MCVRVCAYMCVRERAADTHHKPRWRRSGQPARHSDWQTKRRSVGQLTVTLWHRHPYRSPTAVWWTSTGRRRRGKLCVRTTLPSTSGVSRSWWTVRVSEWPAPEGFTEQLLLTCYNELEIPHASCGSSLLTCISLQLVHVLTDIAFALLVTSLVRSRSWVLCVPQCVCHRLVAIKRLFVDLFVTCAACKLNN